MKKTNTITGKGNRALRKYTATGLRPIMAESMHDAAEVFAQRLARKDYGTQGNVGFVRFHRWLEHSSETICGEWTLLLQSMTGRAWHHASLEVYCHE